jgi:hypothetical protein
LDRAHQGGLVHVKTRGFHSSTSQLTEALFVTETNQCISKKVFTSSGKVDERNSLVETCVENARITLHGFQVLISSELRPYVKVHCDAGEMVNGAALLDEAGDSLRTRTRSTLNRPLLLRASVGVSTLKESQI